LPEEESSDAVQGETVTNTPHTTRKGANVKKGSDEKHPETVANVSINHSKPEHGSKKRQAGKRN
jgi:hypothetical protein